MKEELKIYLDRLSDGKEISIDEALSPEFIDINESDLSFIDPVQVKGKTYLANDHLIIQLDIKTKALIACSICNKGVPTPIILEKFYHTEKISNLNSPIYDYSGHLREAILLEAPSFTECGTSCPERDEVNKFFKNDRQTQEKSEDTHFPFAGLDLDKSKEID